MSVVLMVTLIGLAWYVSGLIGSALVLQFLYRWGGSEVTVGDIVFGAAMALGGPFNLLIGVLVALCRLVSRRFNFDRVVFGPRGG